MSPVANARKTAPASNPPADSDHRKRRRNRTTQSCLNCHNSKRMCDRKRPACARCTQLGLTGTCVYEIDDPNQRQDSQDENARLLKRVAELEGVIRELKNKPHPRWSRSASDQTDRLRSSPRFGNEAESQNFPSDASFFQSSPESGESLLFECSSTCSSTAESSDLHPPVPVLSRPSFHPEHYDSSPQSTPSPFLTPMEEYHHSHFTTTSQPDMSLDYDLSSVFLGLSNLDTFEGSEMPKEQPDDICFMEQHEGLGHCGCLQDSTNYNTVLELSVRLRRAADILGQSFSHHIGSCCELNQRISDFYTFTTNTLGYMMISQEVSSMNQERSCWHPDVLTSNRLYRLSRESQAFETSRLQVWDVMDPDPPFYDDSLMSWEPFRCTTCSVNPTCV